MDWHLLFLLITAVYCPQVLSNKAITTQIDTKKLIQYLPDKFLSMTIDPFTIIAAGPLTQESLNMAKGLSPCFVRIGGKGTNILKFGKEFMKDNNTVSESQWNSVNKFIQDAGLNMILSLNPTTRSENVWDSTNSLELIAYSDKEGFDIGWQLGYDMESTNTSGAEIGKDLMRLKNILDGFPKYSKNAILGPDITSSETSCEMLSLKNFIEEAGSAVTALIMQPEFNDDFEDSEAKIRSLQTKLDTYIWPKNNVKSGVAEQKKPLWIAEPNPSKGSFHDSMLLIKRLGSAAKLGCEVFFRQPGVVSLRSPTPEFWASLLFKNLVGRGVLEAQIVSNNGSGINVFSHCTIDIPQNKSVLDADWNYDKSAVTVFGVNESPDIVEVNLKASGKEEEIHMYVLTSGKQMEKHEYPELTLLNGQKLTLSPSGELPVLSPKILEPSKNAISIPPLSVFFLVMPNMKVTSCTTSPLIPLASSVLDLSKRIKLLTSDKEKTIDLEKSVYETKAEPKYVSFNKRQVPSYELPYARRLDSIREKYRSLTRSLQNRLPKRLNDMHRIREPNLNQDEIPVKYITYNDNSWLNKLKETMSNIRTPEEEASVTAQEITADQLQKYSPLTRAITGSNLPLRLKRSSTVNPDIGNKGSTSPSKKETIEISNLPENVFDTLKQVQVTFTNLDDPKVLNDDEEMKPKQLSVRHIDNTKINEEETDDEADITEENPIIIALNKSDEEELEKVISTPVSETDLEDSEESSNESTEDLAENISTEKVPNIGHIQKINENKKIIPPKIMEPKKEEIMNSPKEKVINSIMTDIIIKENKEPPPLVAVVNNEEKTDESSEEDADPKQEPELNLLTREAISTPADATVVQNVGDVTLPSTTDPVVLEQEIANADKGKVSSKVLRQASQPKVDEASNAKIDEKHSIVERLPGYSAEETESTRPSIVNTIESTQSNQKPSLLKIPLISQDLKLTPESILEEGKERIEALKEKLKETSERLKATINDDNLWNSIKKREEELKNIFRRFDKRETNFSPYEGTRGIQFVTSVPVNEDNISYQIDPIKSRPRRRLTQPVKVVKSEYYDPYQRTNQYLNPTQNSQPLQNSEFEKPLYELPKPENQYLFPLDSKTQGIVYNNKIYPAKLYGVVDVPNQPASEVNYGKDYTYSTKVEEPYVDKTVKQGGRYSSDVQDYVDDVEYTGDYVPPEQTKKTPQSYVQKDGLQQPYIPVVILSQKDKYFPKMQTERSRRSINKDPLLPNPESVQIKGTIRSKRSPLFNPSLMNDIKYRNKMKSKLQNDVENYENKAKIGNHLERNDGTDISEEIGVCKEVGTSKESIIIENDIANKTELEKNQKSKRHSKEEDKKSDDDTTTHHIFTMITDKFKNLLGYVHRIFQWNNE